MAPGQVVGNHPARSFRLSWIRRARFPRPAGGAELTGCPFAGGARLAGEAGAEARRGHRGRWQGSEDGAPRSAAPSLAVSRSGRASSKSQFTHHSKTSPRPMPRLIKTRPARFRLRRGDLRDGPPRGGAPLRLRGGGRRGCHATAATERRRRRRGTGRPAACPTAKPAAARPTAFSTVLRPARAAMTCRPRAWDGQRVAPVVPPAGAEVVPAGTSDRGDGLSGVSAVTVPTAGAVRVRHPVCHLRAGCGKSACPVRRAATGNGATERSEAPASAKAAGNSYPLCLPPPRQSSTLRCFGVSTGRFSRSPHSFHDPR